MVDAEVLAPAVPAVNETRSKRATTKATATKASVPKAKKAAVHKKAKSPRAYPSFLVMISNAIVTLKERTGSSQYAITKFIEEKQKKLPSNFRKLLLVQLKRLVASGQLVKVKNSFKLPPTRSAPAMKPADVKPKPAATKQKTAKVAAKPKAKVAAKPKAKVAAKPKPKSKAPVKAKAAAKPAVKPKSKPAVKPKPKPKTVAKPAKVAKTTSKTTPGKKTVKKARK
ncbi:histone H1 [Hevea brasiliensis]|uniref:histone H1 n=1 Tax=Hevea brasiliensis TaxID=3981 RepID=UPI000B76CA70|nr:histone H1 [Hevea brasiliensis]